MAEKRVEPCRARPHVREFLADTTTPLGVYRRQRAAGQAAFLFESVTGGEQVSRFSFMGVAPSEIVRVYADRLERSEPGGLPVRVAGPPLEALRAVLGEVLADPRSLPPGLPFAGGLVGYFGWDFARLIERLPNRPPDPFGLPVALLGRFDEVVAFDHARRRLVLVVNEVPGKRDARLAERRLDELGAVLEHAGEGGVERLPAATPEPVATLPPTLSDEEYGRAVVRAKEFIAAGDIFQVVLARRFEVPGRTDPLLLYRALRLVNPSPYMVLFESPEVTLAGASPEMLVRCVGDRLTLRPIAGTYPRGRTQDEDQRLGAQLLADPKERAEHVMLVDLGRNDLGRVAVGGGVAVRTFMEVERFSHVIHLTSTIEAQRRPGCTALDALLATFPAGTVSGAPKIRAMEIIDQLEPEARGCYAGAIGYLSYTGDLDTCITMRTLAIAGGKTSVTAGAGIVADSDPQREAQETRDKAAAVLQALAWAQMLERRGATP